MGQAASNAINEAKNKSKEEVEAAKNKITELTNLLENKKGEYIERVKSTRGIGTDSEREVQGGRTVSRISEIRVQTKAGADPGIADAISDFIEVAQGGDKAKASAVAGAKKLLSTGLSALFGGSGGSGMERQGFVILFLNFAFVRIDYMVYSYSVKGVAWGAAEFQSGCCYVADIAVLDSSKDLRPSEIDFLIGQSLYAPAPPVPLANTPGTTNATGATGATGATNSIADGEFLLIMKIKIQLVVSAVLSRMLGNENITLDEVQQTTSKLIETEKLIMEEFSQLTDFDSNYVPGEPKPPIITDIPVE